MDAVVAELGRNPVSKQQKIQPEYSMEMSSLTREGTAEHVSRDQIIIRREREQGNIHFSLFSGPRAGGLATLPG